MLLSGGLLALTLATQSHAAPLHATVGTLPPLHSPLLASAQPAEGMVLHSALLEARPAQRGVDRLAQRRRGTAATGTTPTTTVSTAASASGSPTVTSETSTAPAAGASASANTTANANAGASADVTASAAPAAGGASTEPASSDAPPAEDASAAPEEEEPSIDLLRQRSRMTRIHRPLGIATWSALLGTEVLGTILVLNQHTLFGPGACSGAGGCIFGTWGASGLTPIHEASAFITLGLYTATGIYALGMPDPERASVGNDRRAVRLRIHKALAWVHLVGMVLQPILGIMAASPQAFGLSYNPGPGGTDSPAETFSATMRTIHLGVGYATFLALSGAMIDELIP